MTGRGSTPGTKDPVLVLGGTGHYGRHIVRSLVAQGTPVRVLTRAAAAARKVLGDQPQLVEGDVTADDVVARALEGVHRLLICLSAFSPALIRQQVRIERDAVLAVLDAAARRGVTRLVYLCGYELRPELIDALGFQAGRIMLEVQDAIRASRFNWTILGEPPSMDVFFATLRGSTLVFPGGGPPAFPTVSVLDAGVIAAQAVVRDDLAGRRIRITAPEALSFPEAARRMGAVLGRPINFRAIPLWPLRAATTLIKPFYPYASHVITSARLLKQFPQDLVAQVPADHRLLVETFEYAPTTFEAEVRRQLQQGDQRPN